MKKPVVIFDIETGPLPSDELAAAIPPFDPSSVKVGNAGPEKAAAKIAEAQAEYEANAIERAALDPITGRVLEIGYYHVREQEYDLARSDGSKKSEKNLLVAFWAATKFAFDGSALLVGHNIHGFDLPFLIQRSWLVGAPVPPLSELLVRGRYWRECFVDTMQLWACGKYNSFTGLDRLTKAFGLGGKNGSGADFAKLWESDPKAADAYLRKDLDLTYQVAKKLGVC